MNSPANEGTGSCHDSWKARLDQSFCLDSNTCTTYISKTKIARDRYGHYTHVHNYNLTQSTTKSLFANESMSPPKASQYSIINIHILILNSITALKTPIMPGIQPHLERSNQPTRRTLERLIARARKIRNALVLRAAWAWRDVQKPDAPR